MDKGRVIWITGLSGAGKTTLAKELVQKLKIRGELPILLDGDELREVFGAAAATTKNHGRSGRLALAMQYARLCHLLSSQGMTVVVATISLFKEVHKWNRLNLPGYYEIYLKVPLDVLRERDSKGIYSAYDTGKISNVAGLDLEIEEPDQSDWIVNYDPQKSILDIANEIDKIIMARKNA